VKVDVTILKALRALAARLAATGTDRLGLAMRKVHAREKVKEKAVTISSRFEEALKDELRVKAAIAVLRGASQVEISESLHGQAVASLGLVLYVDPEQFEDIRVGAPPVHEIPAVPFGKFA